MLSTLSIGIQDIDREFIGGGIPVNSFVEFTAPLDSQSSLFLNVISEQRPTLFISTIRTVDTIEREFESQNRDVDDDTTFVKVDPYSDNVIDDIVSEIDSFLHSIDEKFNIIIHPIDVFNLTDDEFSISLLNNISDSLSHVENDYLVIFSGGDGNSIGRDIISEWCDVVMEIYFKLNGSERESYLFISKNRFGGALTEGMKIQLIDNVSIDTSRDIA